jgi:hypothetical protein
VVMIMWYSSYTEVCICILHGSSTSNACSMLLLADTSSWNNHTGRRQTHQTLKEIKPFVT